MSDLLSWQAIAQLLNSNFASALVGALAGAFAGALAAQRIGDRAKERQELRAEIRHTNAAIVVASSICSGGLALKNQVTRDIYETYTKCRTDFEEYLQGSRRAGQQPANGLYEFRADLRSLPMPLLPIDVLRELLYEKISATGRPLALVAALAGSISSLSEFIQNRHRLIEGFKQMPDDRRSRLLPALYFGLQYQEGHVSEEFRDTVEALHRFNDDIIFFSNLLCEDLMAHGDRVVERYRKVAKVKEEVIHRVDYSDARKLGLMPDRTNYRDWFDGFVTTPRGEKP
jgi:hypothetical protein